MSKIERPLNPAAVSAANAKIAPKTGGRSLTMRPEDAALRKEWAAAYQKALAERQPAPKGPPPFPPAVFKESAKVPQKMGSSMLVCPIRKPDAPPPGWKRYEGDPRVFHCGYEGIKEDVTPDPSRGQVQNECFYDEDGILVDKNHPYAGCGGSPNQYDSKESPWEHTWNDEGGIWKAGPDAIKASYEKNPEAVKEGLKESAVSYAENTARAAKDATVKAADAVADWTTERWEDLQSLFK